MAFDPSMLIHSWILRCTTFFALEKTISQIASKLSIIFWVTAHEKKKKKHTRVINIRLHGSFLFVKIDSLVEHAFLVKRWTNFCFSWWFFFALVSVLASWNPEQMALVTSEHFENGTVSLSLSLCIWTKEKRIKKNTHNSFVSSFSF